MFWAVYSKSLIPIQNTKITSLAFLLHYFEDFLYFCFPDFIFLFCLLKFVPKNWSFHWFHLTAGRTNLKRTFWDLIFCKLNIYKSFSMLTYVLYFLIFKFWNLTYLVEKSGLQFRSLPFKLSPHFTLRDFLFTLSMHYPPPPSILPIFPSLVLLVRIRPNSDRLTAIPKKIV